MPCVLTKSVFFSAYFHLERESVVSPTSERKELAIPEVDDTHPDVIAIVEKAVQDAEKNVINLNAEVYIEILEEAIRDAEKKMREAKPDGPM